MRWRQGGIIRLINRLRPCAPFIACKVHIVGNHFKSRAFVAVFVLILACLDRAFEGNQLSLYKILANEFSALPPAYDVDKIRLAFLALLYVFAVYRDTEARNRYTGWCGF